MQSNLVTESWFFQHSEVKKRVIEKVCNLMKLSWVGGKRAGYILGDGGYKLLEINPDIALNDYGIFVNEGAKDDAVKQAITQLSQAALQGGNIGLLDVIKILKSDSLSEAEHVLENGLKEMQQQAQQAQQAQQQAMQMQAEQAEVARQHETSMKQMDAQSRLEVTKESNKGKIEVAQIQADLDADVASDKLKTAIQKEAVQSEYREKLEKMKMDHDEKKSDKDREEKKREVDAKRKLDEKKQRESTRNKINQQKTTKK